MSLVRQLDPRLKVVDEKEGSGETRGADCAVWLWLEKYKIQTKHDKFNFSSLPSISYLFVISSDIFYVMVYIFLMHNLILLLHGNKEILVYNNDYYTN